MEKIATLIARHAGLLFFVYLIGAIAPLLLFRTEFNAPYIFSFRYLTIPIVGFSVYFGFRFRDIFARGRSPKILYWLQVVLVGPILTLLAGGYVSAANAWLPPQRTVELEGVVREKFVSGSKMTSYVVTLESQIGSRRLEVSPAEFAMARVGARCAMRWHIGPFGFAYRNRDD